MGPCSEPDLRLHPSSATSPSALGKPHQSDPHAFITNQTRLTLSDHPRAPGSMRHLTHVFSLSPLKDTLRRAPLATPFYSSASGGSREERPWPRACLAEGALSPSFSGLERCKQVPPTPERRSVSRSGHLGLCLAVVISSCTAFRLASFSFPPLSSATFSYPASQNWTYPSKSG